MKSLYLIFIFLVCGILVSGCAETRKVFGKTKDAPDEFSVYKRAPLSLPPDFELRPPIPGVRRKHSVDPKTDALQALGVASGNIGGVRDNVLAISGLSEGEKALLKVTGAENADSNIRNLVEKESLSLFLADQSMTDKMIFWQKQDFGTVVDPNLE